MFKTLIFSILLINLLIIPGIKPNHWTSEKCMKKIFRDCNHRHKFSAQEIDNARIYLQSRLAKTNPTREPCSRLLVRKNIKCLTPKELKKFISAFKKLYSNGVIDRFTEIHATHWPGTHKFAEGIIWHRWFVNELQKEIFKIDSSVTMPYWEFLNDFSAPEKSIIFDIFGHAGNENNGFCVSDGAFANQTVNYPHKHCVRRQWNKNRKIPVWEPPEFYTSIMQIGFLPSFILPGIQTFLQYGNLKIVYDFIQFFRTMTPVTQPYPQYALLHAYVAHFKTHLGCGGYAGDLSVPIATNDVLFYLFHEWQHYAILKWQLSNDEYLSPKSYSLGLRLDELTKEILVSDYEKDFLTYFNDVPVKETFEVGFGDQCYIYDQLIEPINKIMNNELVPEPAAVQRLRSSLPPLTFAKYFPKFALYPKNVTFFDYIFPDVGDCNPELICKSMPIAPKFTDTASGRRQWKVFIEEANFDITRYVKPAEKYYFDFMNDLNGFYCSPYAT
jgi:tyrosinase